MKIFGSVQELLSLIFRKNSQQITVRPNQSTTYTAARDIQLPPGDADHVMLSASSSQAVSNKTIDSSNAITLKDSTTEVVDATDATKKILFNAAGTTGTSTTLAGSQTANRVLTLPDATDTLTANAAAQTVSNKTLDSTNSITLKDSTAQVVDATDATKRILFDAAGTTGTATTLQGSQSVDRTLTLPDATDTLVGRNTTDTLLNKKLSDSTTSIVDSGDITKRILFDAGGSTGTSTTITGAQTANRVLTLPDATDTLTANSASQVLTNKDYDGGTASNSSRLTLPKAAKATLDGLTRKQGTLLYASDTNVVYSDDGTNLNELGAGGISATITQASHGFTASDKGAPLYLNGSTYTKAYAAAANTAEVVGVISEIISANQFKMTAAGAVTVDTSVSGGALVAGTVYFLHPSNPGQITATEPSAAGSVSLPLGVAKDSTTLYLRVMRGAIVNGSAVRKNVALNNNATTTILDVSASYEAGEMSGWVSITATTPLRFYVQAQFSKNGAATDWNLAYQTAGDTPPSGFSMSITSAGVIQATLPSVTGFSSAAINYAMNVPLYGVTASTTSSSSGINYVSANSDFESGLTSGWATYSDAAGLVPVDGTGGSPSVTLAASSTSPLRGTYSGLFTKPSSTNAQGQGFSFDFSIAAADKSRPLLITWEGEASANYTGSSGSEYLAVYVYDVSNSTLIYPASTTVAPGSSKGSTFFVATTSTSYRLIFHVAGSGTVSGGWTYKIDSVSVGPQSIALGDAPPTSQVKANTGNGFGSSGTRIRRFTSSSVIGTDITYADSATNGASFTINADGVYTITWSDATGTNDILGISRNASSLSTDIRSLAEAERLAINIINSTAFGVASVSVTARLSRGDVIRPHAADGVISGTDAKTQFTITQNAYSTNNVVLADRAVEEYASNNGTWDANDTTSFVYGPNGSVMGGGLSSVRTKRVRFQQPIQPTDRLVFEVAESTGNTWMQIPAVVNGTQIIEAGAFNNAGNGYTGGVLFTAVNSTDVDISFSRYASASLDFSSVLQNWPTGRWRIRKTSGGATVGYPVSSANVVGRTDGASVASGYIGQKIDGTLNTVAYSGITNIGSISLTPGVWMIYGSGMFTWSTLTTFNYYKVGISTANNSFSGQIHQIATSGTTLTDIPTIPAPPTYANVSSTTTYYLNGQLSATGTSLQSINTSMYLYAIRIA